MGALWVPCAPITSAHTMRTNYYQAPGNALGIGGREQQHSILDTLPLTLVTWHLLMIVPLSELDAWRQGNRVTCAILRVKVRLIIPLYIYLICEMRGKTREGRARPIVLAPCFHMSEICSARPENILCHYQQACDQQGLERTPHSYLIFVIFFTRAKFLKNKFTPKNAIFSR